jgi:hypothetical protein
MRSGRLTGASSTALTLSEDKLQEIYDDFDYFGSRIVLRPQEISNNPTVIRQLGVIATNTALEVDIYGHVNLSHVCDTQMMNGIGGAADFERNAGLSVFVRPSIILGRKGLLNQALLALGLEPVKLLTARQQWSSGSSTFLCRSWCCRSWRRSSAFRRALRRPRRTSEPAAST